MPWSFINALGFISNPLYLFPGFMRNKPVELLIREAPKPEDFNDDTLGRALDRLYQNIPTQIFTHIALKAAKLVGVEKKFLHLDTTTMSVHGQHQQQEDEMTPITITYGRPKKNGRNDLKQFIVSLITLSRSDLPIWLDVLSGNSSDKNHFPEVIKRFSKELAAGDGEEVYYVMDATLYSNDNIQEVSPPAIDSRDLCYGFLPLCSLIIYGFIGVFPQFLIFPSHLSGEKQF